MLMIVTFPLLFPNHFSPVCSFCYVYLPHASQEDCTVGYAGSPSCEVTAVPCCCLSFIGMFIALSDLRRRVPTSSKHSILTFE